MPYTARELWDNTQAFMRTLPNSKRMRDNSARHVLMQVVPYAGTNSVLFQYWIEGLTTKPYPHNVNMMFSGIKVVAEEPLYDHFVYTYDGYNYYVQKPDLSKDLIYVRCDCPDYVHTFAWYNHEKKCHFGARPKPYRRKPTQQRVIMRPDGKPVRNPQRYAGGCKHIWSSLRLLIGDYVNEGSMHFINLR